MKSQGDGHKKGCCSFTLKQFYLHPTVGKICYGTILTCKQIQPYYPRNHEMWVKASIFFASIKRDSSIYVGAPSIGPKHLSSDKQTQSSNEGYDGKQG
jgi:hypothetical protein